MDRYTKLNFLLAGVLIFLLASVVLTLLFTSATGTSLVTGSGVDAFVSRINAGDLNAFGFIFIIIAVMTFAILFFLINIKRTREVR